MTTYTRLQIRRVVKGNGNACAFIFPDRSIAIVDWGTDDVRCIESLLDETQTEHIRFVLATHSHADHAMGLVDVLSHAINRKIPISNFFYPAIGALKLSPSDYLGRAAVFAVKNDIPVNTVSVQDFDPSGSAQPFAIAAGVDWDVSILAPPSSSNNRHQIQSHLKGNNPGNPTSIVLLFRYCGSSSLHGRALLPGDATPTVLQFAADHAKSNQEYCIDNDAMVAPHHGSKHNWPSWLTDHAEGIVVISAGANRPKHPSLETLQLLAPQCARASTSILFCTSYAHQCRKAFAHEADDPQLVVDGPCFGDVEIELAPGGSHVISHDPGGPARRKHGYCSR